MPDNDNPRDWIEGYELIALFKVHRSIYEIRTCPICQGVIALAQDEALRIEKDNE